jgi:hypothetical protein
LREKGAVQCYGSTTAVCDAAIEHQYLHHLQVILICFGSVAAAVLLLVAAVVLLGVQISGFGFHRSNSASSTDVCSWHAFRLPTYAVPDSYNLTFDVSLDAPAQVRKADVVPNAVGQMIRHVMLHQPPITLPQCNAELYLSAGQWQGRHWG